jgi:hypothetical protein
VFVKLSIAKYSHGIEVVMWRFIGYLFTNLAINDIAGPTQHYG